MWYKIEILTLVHKHSWKGCAKCPVASCTHKKEKGYNVTQKEHNDTYCWEHIIISYNKTTKTQRYAIYCAKTTWRDREQQVIWIKKKLKEKNINTVTCYPPSNNKDIIVTNF